MKRKFVFALILAVLLLLVMACEAKPKAANTSNEQHDLNEHNGSNSSDDLNDLIDPDAPNTPSLPEGTYPCVRCGYSASQIISGTADNMKKMGIPLNRCTLITSGIYSAHICSDCLGSVT